MIYNSNDYAPYLAIGYQRTKSNKKNRYVWLHKVKFEEISEESKTKEDKPAFQTPKQPVPLSLIKTVYGKLWPIRIQGQPPRPMLS